MVEEERPGAPAQLRGFYSGAASPAALLAAVNTYCAALTALGFPPAAAAPEIVPLLEEAWASAWQQAFPPRAIGDRLLVLPPWEEVPPSSRVRVVVEPGRAFGTGHHGSTEGCLRLLEEIASSWGPGAPAPRRILDLGTGTGILAIAALKLGAERVRALDLDPDAMAATERNADLNQCRDRIDLGLGGLEILDDTAGFDLLLANILAHTHLALAAEYARIVADGGALILGGMLAEEDGRVDEALRPAGFVRTRRLVIEGWSSLLLRR